MKSIIYPFINDSCLPLVLYLLIITVNHCNAIAIDNGVVEAGETGGTDYKLPLQDDQVQCNVRQRPADIQFLVDGSSSVGQENFHRMIDFIMNVVSGFIVSPQVVQVGLTQFSGDPRSEFALNKYSSKNGVTQGLRSVRYLEGSTNTGKALMYLIQNELTPNRGMRPGVPQLAIIITDGASQDDVTIAAGEAARRGIDVFAVAITPDVSDRQLLELVGGLEERVFKVTNFKQLQTDIINKLVEEVCMAVEFRDSSTPPPVTRSGGPSVQCKTEGIHFSAQSKKPFGGKVYIKGYYDNPKCRKVADTSRPSRDIGFNVPMDECGMRRVRSLNPAGVSAEVTIIVSFHPIILTKVDRAYRIKCFFMEAVKMVSSGLDISMLPTVDLMDQAPMPTCTYTIRSQSQDGPVARYANVGDKIYHVWHCTLGPTGSYVPQSQGDEMHALLVHSCTADDGSGNVVQVLDSRGCAVDPVVLQNLIYDGSFSRAYQETHAYKFADRTALYFQCQISLCLKMEPSCRQTVPPDCSAGSSEIVSTGSYGNYPPISPNPIARGPPGAPAPIQRPLSGFVPDYDLAVLGNVDAYTQVDVLEGAGPDPFDSGFSQPNPDIDFQLSSAAAAFAGTQQPYFARIRYSPLGLNFSKSGSTEKREKFSEGQVCLNYEIIAVLSFVICISLLVLTVNCTRLFKQAKLHNDVNHYPPFQHVG